MTTHRVYNKELLERLAKESLSVAQVCKKIGVSEYGSMNTMIKRKLLMFNVDISHFRGQGANFGEYYKGGKTPSPAKDVLVKQKDGFKERHDKLHRCLQEIGRVYECVLCGLKPIWNGKKIILHIDHINGDSYDHRQENLRYLCPNCHSQTDNYCGKNKKANVV